MLWRGVLVKRSVGGYQHFAADVDEDDNAVITLGGESIQINRDKVGWSRLGWAPFAVAWERDDEALEEITAGDVAPSEYLDAEGRYGLTSCVRGGYREFIDTVTTDGGTEAR